MTDEETEFNADTAEVMRMLLMSLYSPLCSLTWSRSRRRPSPSSPRSPSWWGSATSSGSSWRRAGRGWRNGEIFSIEFLEFCNNIPIGSTYKFNNKDTIIFFLEAKLKISRTIWYTKWRQIYKDHNREKRELAHKKRETIKKLMKFEWNVFIISIGTDRYCVNRRL